MVFSHLCPSDHLVSFPYVGSGSLSGCDLRNLTGALGQQPVDGARWHWQRPYNVAPVRQGKCIGSSHAPLWQRNGAYWQPKLHRVTGPWCLQEHIPRTSVQTLASKQLVFTCRGHLGLDAAQGVATLPSADLALFSLRENCLRARIKLGEILQRTPRNCERSRSTKRCWFRSRSVDSSLFPNQQRPGGLNSLA